MCSPPPRIASEPAETIRFSNPRDGAVLADSLVRIEPAVEHVTLSTRGSYLVVNGASRPRTTNRVILDAGIYLARATIPGEYIVPPPRAEEMYHPETFGRGSVDRVRVR